MANLNAVQDYLQRVGVRVSDALAGLLQSKHLYQSVLAFEPPAGNPTGISSSDQLISYLERLLSGLWIVEDPTTPQRPSINPEPDAVRFRPPDVKLFCTKCDRHEAFNLISAEDFLGRGERVGQSDVTIQIFVLSYRCQSCKRTPEVFLVRREGSRLTLSGRTPIEHVAVPPEIPKTVKPFYRGAIIAHQSGQTLAGVFMLRTLIEQSAREVTKRTDYADQVLDAYVETLPTDFRSRFPVLRETYKDLSGEIHSATGTEAGFEKARTEIIEHFEARKVFKL